MKLTKTATKITAGLLIFALTLALTACTNASGEAETNQPKDTPVRVGERTISPSMSIPWETWEEILDEFEFVADVTITEWLGEINSSYNEQTIFNAKVNNVFKGELPDEIKIVQSGSSQRTYDMHPLFQNGNRMLILLDKYSEYGIEFHVRKYNELCEKDGIERNTEHILYIEQLFENAYGGGYNGMFDFDIEEIDGELYLISKYGGAVIRFLHNGESNAEPLNGENHELHDMVIQQLYNNDPLLIDSNSKYVFEYDSFTDEIVEFSKHQNNQGEDDNNQGGNENNQGGGNNQNQGGNQQ
ncbi:MAG: hypothetical protein FWD34_09820 [Oscillospiraceae bacterium]|nr:hypothetical protein [Oscillospiraceae bacterium]